MFLLQYLRYDKNQASQILIYCYGTYNGGGSIESSKFSREYLGTEVFDWKDNWTATEHLADFVDSRGPKKIRIRNKEPKDFLDNFFFIN